MSIDPNRLLFIISAHGRMTWTQFCEAVDFLSAAAHAQREMIDSSATRIGILHSLEALGHCDSQYEQGESTITISPPVLCRLPQVGLPMAVLTGARCPKTLDQIAEKAKARKGLVRLNIERYPGPLGLLPDTILIKSESEISMMDFCSDLNIRNLTVPPAWTLANWCGILSEYEASLDYRIPDTLNWARYDFNTNTIGFSHKTSDSFPRLSRYRNPATGLPLYIFYPDKIGAEIDPRWGRYLFLNSKGITVAAYDDKRFRLCVPIIIPLPAVIARSMCLCSGKTPVHRSKESLIQGLNCQDWLMYEAVPPQIALAALSKVGQSPARVEIR